MLQCRSVFSLNMSVIAAIGTICFFIISYWYLLLHCLNTTQRRSDVSKRKNSSKLVVHGMQFLEKVMEALTDPNTHSIGVFGQCKQVKQTLLEIVNRRIKKDKLFDLVLTVTLTKKPDVKKIQDEIASQLKYTFKEDTKDDKRAQELIKRINERINKKKVLIVLCELHRARDLGKVGIPSGTDPKGCKILITSSTGDVLYNDVHTQKTFGFNDSI